MTEQELYQIPLPEKTRSYVPIPHYSIVEMVKEQTNQVGLEIVNQKFKPAKNGEILCGIFELSANALFNFQIGFQNSYNKQLSVCLVGGTSVIICSNGMIVGKEKFIRRHTGSVLLEVKETIHSIVHGLENDLIKAEQQANKMKDIELDFTATAELCGRMFFEKELINNTQLNIIKKQYKTPDYGDAFSDMNLWSLYNHTTHAMKETAPYTHIQKYRQFHEFIESTYGIKIN